jgi:hypothetical protein
MSWTACRVRLTFRSRVNGGRRLKDAPRKGGNHVINFDAHDIQQRIKLAERKDVQETKTQRGIILYVPLSSLERETRACTPRVPLLAVSTVR